MNHQRLRRLYILLGIGIALLYCDNFTLEELNIVNCSIHGIILDGCISCMVNLSTFTSNNLTYDVTNGMYLVNSLDCTVKNCSFEINQNGLNFENTNNSIVTGNNFTGNLRAWRGKNGINNTVIYNQFNNRDP